ncbi:hypothetical protein PM082_019686 [Marasmius tenuissimus]|nr:hypothetical protein PM082_019686 [Marasmius tenuissimus]
MLTETVSAVISHAIGQRIRITERGLLRKLSFGELRFNLALLVSDWQPIEALGRPNPGGHGAVVIISHAHLLSKSDRMVDEGRRHVFRSIKPSIDRKHGLMERVRRPPEK